MPLDVNPDEKEKKRKNLKAKENICRENIFCHRIGVAVVGPADIFVDKHSPQRSLRFRVST